MTNIVVISAGISVPSSTRILADSLGKATTGHLGEPAWYDVIELRDVAHQITDNALTGFPTGALADAVRRVAEADAVIAVTPVYTGSYSGLFKMFFDVLEDGTLEGKPVLMAATAGTTRHSLVLEFAMRPLFAYLRADVVPTAVFAGSEDFGAGENFGAGEDFGAGSVRVGSLSARIDRAAGELADKVLRRSTFSNDPTLPNDPTLSNDRLLPNDPFKNPTPFEDLLDQQ